MPAREFHLGLIQGVVTRMASNSFLIKGWSITLVSAILAFAADKNKGYLVLLCFVPVVTFWILDAFFIYQEQLFRDLYDRVRVLPGDGSDYSLDTKPATSPRGWGESIFNKTLRLFYGGLVATILIVMCFIPYAPPAANTPAANEPAPHPLTTNTPASNTPSPIAPSANTPAANTPAAQTPKAEVKSKDGQ